MNAIFDALLRIGKVIRETINQSAEDWAVLVEKNPIGAASLLGLAASRLEARARAFKNQKGWRARRNREVAKGLRQEGAAIVRNASLGFCSGVSKLPPWTSTGRL